MRYGVISDVHGNLHALATVLELLQEAGVDRYLCLGDLVGYGPFPNECVERVAALGAVCVAGNHDLMVLGRLASGRSEAADPHLTRWTRANLGQDAREYLTNLPLLASPEPEVLLAHGSLNDPRAYVADAQEAAAQLDALRRDHPAARMLLVGHTHAQFAYGEHTGRLLRPWKPKVALRTGERVVLNPGSVGQSRQMTARACALVLDRGTGIAEFWATRYDHGANRAALRARSLPEAGHHLRPTLLRLGLRHLRRELVAARVGLGRARRRR